MLPKEPYKRFLMIVIYISVGVGAVYIFFRYLWGAILPFVFAYLFAELFKPVVRYSEKHKNFPRKYCVLFLILLATIAFGGIFYALARQLVLEIIELSQTVSSALNQFRTDDAFAADMIATINNAIPFVDISERLWAMRENLDEELWGMAVSLVDKTSVSIFSMVKSIASFLPNAVFALVVMVIATYYFAVDRVRVNCFFLSFFPQKSHLLLKRIKDILANTVGRYLRAYGLLFLITFSELSVAFMVLGLEYALLLALLISLVDILPVLGTGTVLVPWGALMLSLGDVKLGLGLLVTYAVITVVRQIIEPKIIGKFIGIPPLATLASMYIGLKLMGILGLFLFPMGAILIKHILAAREET